MDNIIFKTIFTYVMAGIIAILSIFGIAPQKPNPPANPTTTTTTAATTTTAIDETSETEASSSEGETSSDVSETVSDEDNTSEFNEDTSGQTEETTISPEEVQKEVGILGFMWDDTDKVFYSAHDAWQRNFGYNKYYDIISQFVVIYFDTVRIKFNYAGKDWMIQLWKGQYGLVLIGAEVGVYYKSETETVEHYVCVDDNNLCSMGYTCYSYDDVLFTRTYQDSWWLTGFVPGKLDKFSDRSQLSMKLRITLKDAGMRDKFIEALKNPACGFRSGNAKDKDTYMILGNDVYLMWNTDRNNATM